MRRRLQFILNAPRRSHRPAWRLQGNFKLFGKARLTVHCRPPTKNPDTLLHLGRVRKSMKDPATAARYFQRASTAPSPSADARQELRVLLLSRFAAASAADSPAAEKRWLEEAQSH